MYDLLGKQIRGRFGFPSGVITTNSDVARWMFEVRSTELYTIRCPLPDTLMCASSVAGVVTGSGSPSGAPDRSLMRMRQRFMLPLRSLAK